MTTHRWALLAFAILSVTAAHAAEIDTQSRAVPSAPNATINESDRPSTARAETQSDSTQALHWDAVDKPSCRAEGKAQRSVSVSGDGSRRDALDFRSADMSCAANIAFNRTRVRRSAFCGLGTRRLTQSLCVISSQSPQWRPSVTLLGVVAFGSLVMQLRLRHSAVESRQTWRIRYPGAR